jgi:hypothetical protein
MSKVSAIDLGALRARLILAIEGAPELAGSVYLLAIGSCYLAAAPEAYAELGLWASLFDLQAQLEGVNGSEILATLANVTAVLS